MTSRETPSQPKTPQSQPDLRSNTVQILVANEGNRTAISEMLSDEFDVDTSRSVQEADLYLVEDRLFDKYRDDLRERIAQSHPVFCPVVIVRRDRTRPDNTADTDERGSETPILIDEFVEAPINRQLLVSRLRSLLVRRQQSLELQRQVATLERQERDLRRFERAVEDSGTPTVITDTEGVIEYVNSKFEELTGYPGSSLFGHPLERFLAEESPGRVSESFWRTMAERSEWEGELLIERKDDRRRIAEATITPIRDDAEKNDGFVVVMPDITPRVEQEQLLRDREQELDLLRQILSRYLRHNLRNGLNVILGYAELLEATLPEVDAEDATKIKETAKRLIKTSEEARKYSTLIERESEFAPHDVSATIEGIVSDVREKYPGLSIETELPEECHILASGGITEAIHGVIDNAARHNTADSPWVRVTVTESDSVQIVIEDNGSGISDLERETLDRGSETALKHSQGIGLWLSKWIIEKGDGRLSLDTTDGGGTRVTIDVPPVERIGSRGLEVSDLKAREQRLKTITQRMTDAVIEVDPSWEITYVDEQAENILGIDADAVQGTRFWDAFPDTRDTRFEAVYREVMQSRSAQMIEEYYGGIDGWLAVYVYPDFDGGLSFYFRDVTGQKERERELGRAHSRMELALEQTNAAVWEWVLETDSITMHPERDPVSETKLRTIDDFFEEVYPGDRSRVREALETAVETESPYDVEYRVRVDEGVRWAADHGELQYDADGDATRMLGVVRDITERKEREAELELKSQAMDEAPVGITITDPARADNPIVYANDRFERLTGYPKQEALGLNCRFLQGESTDAERVTEMRESIGAGQPVTAELRNYRKDGTEFWNRITIAPMRADGGEITNFVGFQRDVTDNKESEQYRQRIYEITSAAQKPPAQKIEQLLELGREMLEMENGHVAEIDRDRQRHTVWYATGSGLATSGMVNDLADTFCRRTIDTDGSLDIRDVEATSAIEGSIDPIEGIGCYVGTKLVFEEELFGTVCFVDREPRTVPVTDREKALVDLIGRWIGHILQSERQREAREAILSRMTDALFSVDDEWRITYTNDDARAVLNTAMGASYSSEELHRRRLWDEIPGLAGTRFGEKYREAMDTQQSVTFREYYEPLDAWFDVRAYPSASGVSVYFSDVTEKEKRETEIRTRERTLRELYEVISDTTRSFDEQVRGLLEIGTDAIGVEYGSLSRIRGDTYTFEVVDAPAGTISPDDVVDLSATNCERAVLTEETVVLADVAADPEASEKDGHTEWGIDCYVGTPVFVDGEVYGTFCFYSEERRPEPFSEWEVTLVDLMGKWISYELDRRRTEKRLRRQNDRLDRFASVVSHDLRNPLRVAEGRLELAAEECQCHIDHHERISDALGRMDELIEDVLTLARDGDEIDELEHVDLGALIESSWENVDTKAATLVIETATAIRADGSRLQQLLENLLRNAIEHGGGDVTVTVGKLDDGFHIADDGSGIPAEERERIFDSGYSSTDDGSGFGLGIVQEIVAAHGWDIRVTESDSGGTRFEITGVEFVAE